MSVARNRTGGVRAQAWVLAVLCFGGVGCAQEGRVIDGARGSIVDGEPTLEHDAVVYVQVGTGPGSASCTGTLVAPQAVLTAKHCIDDGEGAPRPAEEVRVFTGNDATEPIAQYLVTDVRPAPGSWEVSAGADLAVLFLAEAAEEAPMELSFDSPVALVDRLVTAVGYGMTPTGEYGEKLAANKRIERVDSHFLWIEPTICAGDSGGPAIGPEGLVWGVASFIYGSGGTDPECGMASGAYNTIQGFDDFILDAVWDSGYCIPSGEEEMCNGRDDNCDGTVDEGCLPLGDPCASSERCTGGLCADAGEGPVCTQACDPLAPTLGCPAEMHCVLAPSCEGLCAPGTVSPDAGGLGAPCESPTDCHSHYCGDGGDGTLTCMQPCLADMGLCLAGEACSAAEGCGGCITAEAVSHPRGLGEPCANDGDCASGHCLQEAGIRYCTHTCAGDGDCVQGFHCRGEGDDEPLCIRGGLQPLGGPCVSSGDCRGDTVCAWTASRRWCTVGCTADECPSGFVCDEDSHVCAPIGSLLGEGCDEDAECVSGSCETVGGRRICTQPCRPEEQCGPGLQCVRVDDMGAARCAPPEEGGAGGCTAAGGGPGHAPGPGHVLWLLVGAFAWRRWRRAAAVLMAVGIGVAAGACTDLEEFRTEPDAVYRGMVRGTEEASFIRRGFPERTVMELAFDPDLADSAPGWLRTDDTACGAPTFSDTPLRAVPPLAHDHMSLYDFPGAARVRNFFYLASPDAGPLAGQEVPVFVSLIRGGKVEVRVMSGFGTGACDPADECTCFFGVFELVKEDAVP